LRMASSGSSPIPLDVSLNWRLVAFSVAVSGVTGLLFGLGPALRLSRTDVHEVLKPGGRVVGSQGIRAMAMSRGLVVGQVALSLMLLIGAALFVRTLGNLLAADLGFDRATVVGARFDPVLAAIPKAQWPDLGPRLVEAARAVPGVRGVTVAVNGPYSGSSRVSNIQIDGEAERPGPEALVREEYVGPDYFTTIGMPLVAGRDLSAADDPAHPPVAVVNEAMARHFFGKTSPLGKRFGYGAPAALAIVGVVRDARLDGVRRPVLPMVFYPVSQAAPGEVVRHLYVRVTATAAQAGGLPTALRSAIRTADPRLAAWDIATLDQLVDRTLTTNRLVSQLTALFGFLAVAVASLGLYGTLSYSVARRTNEIGLRLALGAAPSAVRWVVLRDAVWLVLVGCAVGLVAALLGLTSVGALLYGLSPRDPATFAGATAILFVVSALAAAVPAWRASRVDPLVALRSE
jgi:putative ABC transport system permease protein